MKSSTHYVHVKTKILAGFQICISVPLRLLEKTLKQIVFYATQLTSLNFFPVE